MLNRLFLLLATAFALLVVAAPLTAQVPPQVAGVQLEVTTGNPAPTSYTLTGQFGGTLTATATSNGKITEFELNGERYFYSSTRKGYINATNMVERFKFTKVSEGHYTYALDIWDTEIGWGTATAN